MKTKRFVSTLLALLLICGLPLSAFAETWYVDDGDITVNATESGQTVSQGTQIDVPDSAPVITQSSSTSTTNSVTINAEGNATANVTIQDVNIVISTSSEDTTNYKGQAAVTIDVAEGASANVTLSGVNIDTRNTGGATVHDPTIGQDLATYGYAAVQITGNGDVTMELDGENTVRSGYSRAGVEKNTTGDSGKGTLTITDENGTSGSLNATGGKYGAGIGGRSSGNGSNITITGSAEVIAQGGGLAAGIGGGCDGSGNDITITGSAEVIAQGGVAASGIGGGYYAGSSNIIVSEDAQVKAQGGSGAIVNPNTNDLDEGWIATYAPGTTDLDTATPDSLTYKDNNGNLATSNNAEPFAKQEPTCTDDGYRAGFTVNGTQVGGQTLPATGHSFTNYISDGNATYDADGTKTAKCDRCDATHTTSDPGSKLVREEVPQTAPLYRVIGQDGKAIDCKAMEKDGVLTVTVDADFASLTGSLGGINALKEQGIDTIVFVTKGASSTFALSDLLAQGTTGDSYTLNHDGAAVSFTLDNGADLGKIISSRN